MGLFKSLKKAVMKVVKGVQKVFKKVGEVVGKVLDSGLGKILMIGLTIVTLGSALIAGYGAFSAGMTAGQGFVSAVIEGGKAFVSALAGKKGVEEGVNQGVQEVAKEGAKEVAKEAAAAGSKEAIGAAVKEASKTVGENVVKDGFLTKAANVVSGATSTPIGETLRNTGSLLWDGAKAVGNFAKENPGLIQLGGNIIQGYAQGKTAEELQEKELEEARRQEDLWANFDMSSLTANVKGSNARPIYSKPFRESNVKGNTGEGMLNQGKDETITSRAGAGRVSLDRGSALSEVSTGGQ